MEETLLILNNYFQSISLAEMSDVSLLKRTDTKFIMPKSLLPSILNGIEKDYRVLAINSKFLMSYNTVYYDTPKLKFYRDHHRGKIRRTKIRIRKYVDSEIFFLELKMKEGRGNTIKKRIRVDGFEKILSGSNSQFIHENTGQEYDLQTSLRNSFNRLTLVNIANKERATIDVNLSFSKGDKMVSFPHLCIIELKQEGNDRNSKLYEKLKLHHIRSSGISKYCIGMMQLYKGLKQNNFKPKLQLIKKTTL